MEKQTIKQAKYCPKCGKTKPSDQFYRSISRYDGLRAYCKECELTRTPEQQEYYRVYMRERYRRRHPNCHLGNLAVIIRPGLTREERIIEYDKLRRVRDKEKLKCRSIFNYAVSSGKINRKPCVICSKPNTQGHHIDYNRPFDVIWLCPKHHKRLHLQLSSAL